ncbi:MAG: hypothetical protein PHR35_02645 [Kiritimatiellae bacterium]|nr:hypothetical protein [Kiritimatiellia bacterium]
MKMKHSQRLVLAVAWFCAAGAAGAGDVLFNVSSGDWNTPASWNPTQVPTLANGDFAKINNAGTATVSTAASAANMQVGCEGNGHMKVVDGGALTVGTAALVGSSSTLGSILQTGGAVTSQYLRLCGTGTYRQEGGRCRTTGSAPTFLEIGYSGLAGQTSVYTFVDGILEPSSIQVGEIAPSVGRFVQQGGTVASATDIILGMGGVGYYDQYGGTSVCAQLFIPHVSEGHYKITNGFMNAKTGIRLGRYNNDYGDMEISGSGHVLSPSIRVGAGENNVGGRGLVVQNGGVVEVTAELPLGHGINTYGRYELGAGSLTTASLIVSYGAGAVGSFIQSGGVLTCGALVLGQNATTNAYMLTQGGSLTVSSGVYLGNGAAAITARWDIAGGDVDIPLLITANYANLAGSDYTINQSGGSLDVSGGMMLGNSPNGTHRFTQTGGTNTVGGSLIVGRHNDTVGSYHISGGKLQAGTLMLVESWAAASGLLHVEGSAPTVEATTFTQNDNGGALQVTLDRHGGMRPIAVSGTATLNGTLTIGGVDRIMFEPGMVVTMMTYNARSGAFTETNFLNGVSCTVNYQPKMITLENLQPVRSGTIVLIR